MTGAVGRPGRVLYPRPIGFNVMPLAGSFTDGGYTEEEWKLVNETRKILGVTATPVEPTCVRVPVLVGHGVAASLRFERAMGPAEAIEHPQPPGRRVWTDDKAPTPLDTAGVDDVLVGRVRATLGRPGGHHSGRSATTCARVPPSTPSRSPSCSSHGRFVGSHVASEQRGHPAS